MSIPKISVLSMFKHVPAALLRSDFSLIILQTVHLKFHISSIQALDQDALREELLRSVSNHCGYRPRGPKGAKRLGTIWEIQKYIFPGGPLSKIKNIEKIQNIHSKKSHKKSFFNPEMIWQSKIDQYLNTVSFSLSKFNTFPQAIMVFDFNPLQVDDEPGNIFFWIFHILPDLQAPLRPLDLYPQCLA